jgi:hypothetical protein
MAIYLTGAVKIPRQRCGVERSENYSLAADAARGAEAGACMLSSGARESALPDVSGVSPTLTADAATGVLAGNGAMLAGRAGMGGTVGIYSAPRCPQALSSVPADKHKAATIALIRKTTRITVPE